MSAKKSLVLEQKDQVINFWQTDIDTLPCVNNVELKDIIINHPFINFENRIISTIFYFMKYEPKSTSFNILKDYHMEK